MRRGERADEGGERADGGGVRADEGGERADGKGREQRREGHSTDEVWNSSIDIQCAYEHACCGMAVLAQVCTTTLY